MKIIKPSCISWQHNVIHHANKHYVVIGLSVAFLLSDPTKWLEETDMVNKLDPLLGEFVLDEGLPKHRGEAFVISNFVAGQPEQKTVVALQINTIDKQAIDTPVLLKPVFEPQDPYSTARQQYFGQLRNPTSLPDDLKSEYFQRALPDQQIEGFFTPGEPYRVYGMTDRPKPDEPLVSGRLPAIVARCFIKKPKAALEEMPTVLDTVAFFPNHDLGVVTYRTTFRSQDFAGQDIHDAMFALDHADKNQQYSQEHFQQALENRQGENKGLYALKQDDLLPQGELLAVETASFEFAAVVKHQLKSVSQAKKEAEKILEDTAKNAHVATHFKSEVEPTSILQLPIVPKDPQLLANQAERLLSAHFKMVESLKSEAIIAAAQLPKISESAYRALRQVKRLAANDIDETETMPDVTISDHAGELQKHLDAGQSLTGVDLSYRSVIGLNLKGADLTKCDFTGCRFEQVNFQGADLTGANFSESQCFQCVFTEAILDQTIWSSAKVVDCDWQQVSFCDAQCRQMVFCHNRCQCALFNDVLWESCQWVHNDCRNTTWGNVSFYDTQVVNSDFRGALWEQVEANLIKIHHSDFRYAQFEQVGFHDTQLRYNDFSYSRATQIAVMGDKAQIRRCVFNRAHWCEANFTECRLYSLVADRAQFPAITLLETVMVRCRLTRCYLPKAQLSRAILIAVVLQRCLLDQSQWLGTVMRRSVFEALQMHKASGDFIQSDQRTVWHQCDLQESQLILRNAS